MSQKMFLDDERFPPNDGKNWVIVRSFEEAVTWIENNYFPNFISFDNDLGFNQKEGWEFAQWLIDYDIETDKMPIFFTFDVHSQNPSAAENIRGKLNGYIRFKRGQ